MEILVFTDSRRVRELVCSRRVRSREVSLQVGPLRELRGAIAAMRPGTICYLDFSALGERQRARLRGHLAGATHVRYAVIDPGGTIKDVGRLFHEGAVDYLGKAALQKAFTATHLARLTRFLDGMGAARSEGIESRPPLREELLRSAWRTIVPGREYTFYLMFIELDGKAEMEKKYGMKNLGSALVSFRQFIDGSVRPFGGKLWIWSNFGGLILFPFTSGESPAVTCAFRLILFKHLYDVEQSVFPGFVSFRTVLHIGNTVYREEDTGGLISDSLNSIFHLGQHFAPPGSFCATAEALEYAHPALRGFFRECGSFEGRRIYRMRLPLHGGVSSFGDPR